MRSLARRLLCAGLLLAASAWIGPVPLFAGEARSITDARGPHSFASAPERVISLNWALTEQLISLGIAPVGVADPEGYSNWVAVPAIPEASVDIGKREAPNLERILGLQPDLLLLGGQQSAYVQHAEAVAPALQFQLYSEDHDNAAAIRDNFLALGTLFDRRALAEQKLAEMDRNLARLRDEIAAAYPDGAPKVTLVRFIDDKRVVISGKNGMPEAAMNALGLKSGYPTENSRWGIAFKPVTALAAIKEGYVLHMEPFEKGDQLFNTELWHEMPFVKSDRFRTLPTLWTYGGALSIGRIGEQIAETLMADKN
ncbi:ABC transporter substrate-binding protein [Nisaea acidiphila]|uniref:ABC transporter substrate-binding protein n=1 Tax=Nisaea acidiphila TaxID=1862145 RepID=A0A9J7AUS3_9PROT|nr:ABC transporter substrate-binding protein [Nisaea acidiphila]UUX51080.1 ABC transporter substrate-binding protein [Nisaea acidiphila]